MEIVPTWRNNERGVEWLEKMIDGFLIFLNVLEEEGRIRSWTSREGYSNHRTILF
jgi:hypothetical protein